MVDLSAVPHHPAIEDLTSLICERVQNNDRAFFRPLVAYHLLVTASTMRTSLNTLDRGEIPVNGYVAAFSTSGSGKGFSLGILEHELFGDFRRTFTTYTLPHLAEASLWRHAMQRAVQKGTTEQIEFDKLQKDYNDTGEYLFTFDDAHPSVVKQIRDKLLMSQVGSINLLVDEAGRNLEKINPLMPLFLELYDQGYAKPKAYMNNAERKRMVQIEGKTPANMLLLGTPDDLLDGGATEDLFYSLLGAGLARRMMFAHGSPIPAHHGATDAEIFDALCDQGRTQEMQQWADHFATLADPGKFNWTVDVPRDIGIELLSYRHECEDKARELQENAHIPKAELSHRYFKTLKLAGALAFVDESLVLTRDHLYGAMKLVEESGDSFQSILTRERAHMKLARYISTCSTEVTHADLTEDLPFYKPGVGPRTEMMMLATAWGYKNGIVIKKRFIDDVEFFSGETLKETSLDKLHLSHSDHFAEDYTPEKAPFDQLHQLVTMDNYNWCVHSFENGHRLTANAIPGFNLAVFDVDGGITREDAHEFLEDHTFMTYTTKRHTPDAHRFRLIMPLNYTLKLDLDDYKEFMANLITWLPFPVDLNASKDYVRKWATNPNALVHTNHGELLDVLPFIPRTKRNEDRTQQMKKLGNLDAMDRWFIQKITKDGDRNKHMIRYALCLVDNGMPFPTVEHKLLALDKQLPDPLGAEELRSTVLVTVAKKLQAQAA